jgi:hypothetical protein
MPSLLLSLLIVFCLSNLANAACPPASMSRASLMALKSDQWKIADDEARQAQALTLLDCLADPDPVMRDEVAFEALSFWMRGGQLQTATVKEIYQRLLTRLDQPADAQGVAPPFAVLALAEVARVDRLKVFLSAPERQTLVDAAAKFLTEVRDYRGYDAIVGWRHGVAHGADLMLQLSLNPELNRTQQIKLLAAIATQIAPKGHAYQYGESERLMAPVFYLARRTQLEPGDWDKWFASLSQEEPQGAENLQEKLTRWHNLNAFLYALYFSLQESGDAMQKQNLLPAVRRALKSGA